MKALGDDWHGWEFWYVATEMQRIPSELAERWSRIEILEAYYFLRLKYLRTPPGGA